MNSWTQWIGNFIKPQWILKDPRLDSQRVIVFYQINLLILSFLGLLSFDRILTNDPHGYLTTLFVIVFMLLAIGMIRWTKKADIIIFITFLVIVIAKDLAPFIRGHLPTTSTFVWSCITLYFGFSVLPLKLKAFSLLSILGLLLSPGLQLAGVIHLDETNALFNLQRLFIDSSIGFLFFTFIIFKMKGFETQLKEDELRERIHFQGLLKVLPDMVFIQDINTGEYTDFYSNDHQPYLAKEHFIGKTHHEVLPMDHCELIDSLMTAVKNSPEIQSRNYQMTQKGKVEHFVSYSARLDETHMITISRNISEIKESEQALRVAKIKAEQAAEHRSVFLRTMSHEVRTPLNGVIGTSHLLLEQKDLQGDSLELTQTIVDSSEHLLSTLNDILDYSKIDAGVFELDYHPTQLKSVCQQSIKFFNAKASEKGLELEAKFQLNPDDVLMCDSHRLLQVLSNLISNAIKFTNRGKVSLRVNEVQRLDKSSSILFEVTDTGRGMSQAFCENIFTPFSQERDGTSRSHEGTGLGVSIAHKIIQLFGSDLKVKSQLQKGSTFSFELQLNHSVTTVNKPIQKLDPQFKSNLRILIAEDNFINQKLIGRILKKWDISFQIVPNGEQAIEVYNPKNHDLILMDLHMPIINGLDASKIILKKFPDTIIYALTADVLVETKNELLEIGVQGILTKPFKPVDIQSLLEKVQTLEG